MPPPWTARLHELLRRIHLPAEEVVAAGGLLRITLREGGGAPFVATLRPRSGDTQGWANVGRFVLGYDGARPLDRCTERWMNLILQLVQRVEPQLPASFDVAEGVFSDTASPEERFRRLFPFANVERSIVRGEPHTEVLLRATALCNQQCPFCSAPEHATPSHEAVLESIRQAAQLFPSCMLSLTGGEPTLRRTFADEVALAVSQEKIRLVQIQTNAVAFASKLDPAFVSPGPNVSFFVSLHAVDEDTYDRCTGTRGQMPLALAGIRRILGAGHDTTLNCVVNSLNVEQLESYVRALPGLLPLTDRTALHFSTLICAERRPETTEYLVRYPVLAVHLQAAVKLACSLGIDVESLRASTHAAIPACMLDEAWREWNPHRPAIDAHETGFEDQARPWVKAEACRGCVESAFCLGVPRPYAQRFGLAELVAIRRA